MAAEFVSLRNAIHDGVASYDALLTMLQDTMKTARRPYDGSSLYRETLELLDETDKLHSPEALIKYVAALNTYLNYRGSRDYSFEATLRLNAATKTLCLWFLAEKVYTSKDAAATHLALTPPPHMTHMRAIS